MRKQYKPKQKAQIVLEMLKEERTVTQISSEYGIHTSQLYKWKNQALEGLPNLFEEDLKTEKALKAKHEKQLNNPAELAQKKIWHRTDRELNGCSIWSAGTRRYPWQPRPNY